jgi:hypothetical protein
MIKGKGGDDKDGDDKDGDNKDGPAQIGARVTFQAHGETHTQYIDVSGGAPVAMVASTPSAVKGKIEEWRPRLHELPDADQKRAGKLIGKAIAIEGKVSDLATKAKAGDTASNTALADRRAAFDTGPGQDQGRHGHPGTARAEPERPRRTCECPREHQPASRPARDPAEDAWDHQARSRNRGEEPRRSEPTAAPTRRAISTRSPT